MHPDSTQAGPFVFGKDKYMLSERRKSFMDYRVEQKPYNRPEVAILPA
jgi:hypothetical protein